MSDDKQQVRQGERAEFKPSEQTPSIVPPDGPPYQHKLEIRVAYHETDGQRRVHHANYIHFFERGRVEMLRSGGIDYKAIENAGFFLVVRELNIHYHAAAEFDDLLQLTTEVEEIRKVRIRHRYWVHRGDALIVEASSVIACVDSSGRPKRLPSVFLAYSGAKRR